MVEGLPTIYYETLKSVMELLHFISTRGVYSMDPQNLSVCLNPSLCFAKDKESPETFINLNFIITSLSTMIKFYPSIFESHTPNPEQVTGLTLASGINTTVADKLVEDGIIGKELEKIEREEARTPTKTRDPSRVLSPVAHIDDDLRDRIQRELDRMDSHIHQDETLEELERDMQKKGRLDDYGIHSLPNNFLDKRLLFQGDELFNEVESAASSGETPELDEHDLQKRKKFHASLSKIVNPNITENEKSEQKEERDNLREENEKLMQMIQQLQNENYQMKQKQTEICETLERISITSNTDSSSKENLETIKTVASHELQQLRKYIYNVEEQTIDELKSMWTKMDQLEAFTKRSTKQHDAFYVSKSMTNIAEEIKSTRKEIRDLYGGFREVNERMKTIEIDYRDINSRMEELLKEQRFIKTRQEYDVEHLKRLMEDMNSKQRQLGLELTTIRSRVDARTTPVSTTKPSSQFSTSPKLLSASASRLKYQ